MSRSDNFNAINSIGNGEVDSSILSGSTSFSGISEHFRFLPLSVPQGLLRTPPLQSPRTEA